MKKAVKWVLTGAGLAAAGYGLARAFGKLFADEALDRRHPAIIEQAEKKIGNPFFKVDEDVLQMAAEKTARLREYATETVTVTSHDGLQLTGHLWRAENQKRVMLAMHGWRSTWATDFGVIAPFFRDEGCTILFAEQRGQGESDGTYMGFGVLERHDCLTWMEWLGQNGFADVPLYLAGVSMGATTVLMATGFEDLPSNLRGVIADCGFTSPQAIWQHVMQQKLHLPYALIRRKVEALCEERIEVPADGYSTLDAMAVSTTPTLFIHGTADGFVPVEMSRENYEACHAPKHLLIVEGADHGMSYYVEQDAYQQAVRDFFAQYDTIEKGNDSDAYISDPAR